jgi:hypothetical protein
MCKTKGDFHPPQGENKKPLYTPPQKPKKKRKERKKNHPEEQ